MITFIAITTILTVLALITAAILALGGTAFLVVFGDLIVFAMILYVIFKLFKRKK
jgi:hypothetical protein